MRVEEKTRVSLTSVHRIYMYSLLTGCFFNTNTCKTESTNTLANNTQNWREPSKRGLKKG